MIQEEVENKSVVLATNTAKLTARTLARLMSASLRKIRQSRNNPKQGRQSIKQLVKGGSVSNIEITDGNIKAFEPIARKYGISYSLKKDNSQDPPRWMVFFRSKDADALTAAFKEFSAKTMKKSKDKPSTRESMKEYGETIKNTVKNRTKHKHREGHEL